MERLANMVFRSISPLYMNKRSVYDETYFYNNHEKRVHSWYGKLVALYYRYVAGHAMAAPSGTTKGGKVLDVGCGTGILVQQFRHIGFRARGVDISKAAIQSSVSPEYCSLVDTTARLDFSDNSFDLIVSREVLEHIPAPEIDACIQEWDRVGKGKMVHLIAVAEHGACAVNDPTHVNVQPERWWIDKFQQYGYTVTRKPRRWFLSPFGNTGYLMMTKE